MVTTSSGQQGGADAVWETLGHDEASKATHVACVAILARANLPIAYDVFSDQVMITGRLPWRSHDEKTPRQWDDIDTIDCKMFAERLFIKPSKEIIHDAIIRLARQNKFHIVRDYLDKLIWDGKERLPNLLPGYFGAINTPYSRAIGTKFMISAVARIMKPGCKVDTVLVLEGEQGKGKSTAIAALAGAEWFTDELPDLRDKDAAIQLKGKWVIEVAELDALKRAEVSTIKKFMSRSTDRYRAPYGKTATDHKRHCVFIATTNEEGYLKDHTGNRRFWPVACGSIDLDAIRRERDQLWAEGVARYQKGEIWWLEEIETVAAQEEQEARREVDPWEEAIADYITLIGGLPTTMKTICATVLNIPFGQQHAGNNTRIKHCLEKVGYERVRRQINGKRSWLYELKSR